MTDGKLGELWATDRCAHHARLAEYHEREAARYHAVAARYAADELRLAADDRACAVGAATPDHTE